jgi:uncharacterized protein (TIGR02996 family)
MSEEQAFLDLLSSNPGDDLTRQVYADWHEEHDDRRGEYLRMEIELAGVPEWNPLSSSLAEEARRLREGVSEDWLACAGKRFDVVLHSFRSRAALGLHLRELTACGEVDVELLAGELPSCLLAGVVLPKAEALCIGLRGKLEGIDIEMVPTTFEGAAYEALLGADRSSFIFDEESRQKAEVERQRGYNHLASLLGRDVRLSREQSRVRCVSLKSGIAFPEAEALRLAGLPVARVILRRLPASPEPTVFSFPGAFRRNYDLVMDSIDPTQEDFVAWVVRQVTGWSLAETQMRLKTLPRRIKHGLGWEEALWAFRRFRGRADIRVVPCV